MKISSDEFRGLEYKSVTLIGMSGIGKTTLARRLPRSSWFHFSADYRIGTRYLSEPIIDNIKEQAMNIGFLRDLLRGDSIYIGSAMTFDNLELMSKFVGMIGNPELGGLDIDEFHRRQELHRKAEVRAMLDVGEFVRKAHSIYGYKHFVNDASGSICELGDADVLAHLAEHTVIIYIKPNEKIENDVIERQVQYPKPLYYEPAFLDLKLHEFMKQENLNSTSEIDPNKFVSWVFPLLAQHRRPKYEKLASEYGYTVLAEDAEQVLSEHDFIELICSVLDNPEQSPA